MYNNKDVNAAAAAMTVVVIVIVVIAVVAAVATAAATKSCLAETNQTTYDSVEGESELVSLQQNRNKKNHDHLLSFHMVLKLSHCK
jgi:competence protein ComGC